jgi:hypothetical protein
MKFAAAILTLIAGLLLLGLARQGYLDNARLHAESLGIDRSNAHNIGRNPIPYTPRPSESWQAIDQAEEQGRLATAGVEGFLGLVLLFAAVGLCGPTAPKPTLASSEYNLRDRPGLRDRPDRQVEPLRPDSNPSSIRSGRTRIEELRKPKPEPSPAIPSFRRDGIR